MKKLALTGFVAALAFTLSQSARAADDPKAIVDKGIKALGGEEKLSKVKAYSWKSKGKIKFMENEGEFTSEGTIQGLDHLHTKFSGDFGGMKIEAVAVLGGGQRRGNLRGRGTYPERGKASQAKSTALPSVHSPYPPSPHGK